MNVPARLRQLARVSWGGPHQRVRTVCGLATTGLFVLIVVEFLPTQASSLVVEADRGGPRLSADELNEQQLNAFMELIQKRSLFKPAAPLPVRGMARDSVKRIRDSLSLHGILERGGERLAYINVKGLGMKSYRAGDEEQSLFKVVRIEERSVEVEIVGERLQLEL